MIGWTGYDVSKDKDLVSGGNNKKPDGEKTKRQDEVSNGST